MDLPSQDIKRFQLLKDILWDQGEEIKDLCEKPYGSVSLPTGPWEITLEPSASLSMSTISNVKSTTSRLDLRKAPRWKEATEKYGNPEIGILPAMGIQQRNQSMLVIEDYRKLYGILMKEDQATNPKGKAKGPGLSVKNAHALIVGNPGIGKTWALDYILYRRLLEGEPTLYRRNSSESLLFTAQGVESDEEVIEKHLDVLQNRKTEVWVLVDEIEPRATDLRRPFNRLIQTTIPDVHDEAEWAKKSFHKYYRLDLWKWEEIYLLKDLMKLSTGNSESSPDEKTFVQRLWTIFTLFGGEPRLMSTLECHRNGLKFSQSVRNHIQTVKLACKQAVAEQVKDGQLFFRIPNQSHIFMASRPFSDQYPYFGQKRSIKAGREAYSDARSPFIASILQKELYKRGKSTSLSVMKDLIDHKQAKAVSNAIFDSFCLRVSISHKLQTFCEAYEFISLNARSEKSVSIRTVENRFRREIAFGAFLDCIIPGNKEVFNSYKDLNTRITMGGMFNSSKLGVIFRPKSRTLAGVDYLVFYREAGRTNPIYLALFQHVSELSRPVDVSGIQALLKALPSFVNTKGRGIFGPLVFVVGPQNFDGFQKQAYNKLSAKDSIVWEKRFPQVKIRMSMELFEDIEPERLIADATPTASIGKRKTLPEIIPSTSKWSGTGSSAGPAKRAKKE